MCGTGRVPIAVHAHKTRPAKLDIGQSNFTLVHTAMSVPAGRPFRGRSARAVAKSASSFGVSIGGTGGFVDLWLIGSWHAPLDGNSYDRNSHYTFIVQRSPPYSDWQPRFTVPPRYDVYRGWEKEMHALRLQ